jgi:spoIIIJ-associated protein
LPIRDLQSCNERLANLIELLIDKARFEINATIRTMDAEADAGKAQLAIHFTGRDTSMLLADKGRLLDAIEQLAADMLELSTSERHMLHIDVDDFLAARQMEMRRAARAAESQMHRDGTPHVFPPMRLRDRLLLERELFSSGLSFEILGNEPARWIVLVPRDLSLSEEVLTIQGTFH